MNLGIVLLYVNDIVAAKNFYTDVIGFSVVEDQSGPTFVLLRPTNGSFVALQDMKTVNPAQARPAGGVELCLEVDHGVDSIWSDWKAKGAAMVVDPVDMPFGRTFTAKDPEGYFVTVYRPPVIA